MKPRVDLACRKSVLLSGGLVLLSTAVSVSVLGSWSRPADPETIALGRQLFEHKWVPGDSLARGGDGLGPVFNGQSCVQCHFQGGVGGAGPNEHNVMAFDVQATRRNPTTHSGVVHKFSLTREFVETQAAVSEMFPIIPGGTRVINGCSMRLRDFNPVTFSEINTPALFGAGLMEQIPDRAIRNNSLGRQLRGIGQEFQLNFEATPTGRVRVLPDGRVGKFGWKAQFATLEEFVATACAVELGLSNPLRPQSLPGAYDADPDAEHDMDREQLSAMVAFVDQLKPPVRILPIDPSLRTQVERGEQLFSEIGCADCHRPSLASVEGFYSDLLLYDLEQDPTASYGRSDEEVPPPQGEPLPQEWKTPPLWGVADSAPYFHDGMSPTLEAAITRHRGQARHVTAKFEALSADDRQAVVEFLKSLRAPSLAMPGERIVAR